MTIIQPQNKKNILNKILLVLILSAMFVSFALVAFYVRFVNLNHGIAKTREAIEEVQTANAELKDKIFALLDRSRLESLAAEKNLVKEKNPQYFQAPSQPLALSR